MADFFKPADGVRRTRTGQRERKAVSTAVGLTASAFEVKATAEATQYGANDILPVAAVIQVIAQPINFTVDGTTATTLLGFVAQANDMIYLNSLQEIRRFSAIKNGGTDSAIEVLYLYGR